MRLSRLLCRFLLVSFRPLLSPVGVTLPPSRRLTHDREFQAVYAARLKKTAGPLIAYAAPNALPHHRLGLAVRKHTTAIARNRLKRLLREAFRLMQHELSFGADGGYDLIFAARAHAPAPLADYQQLMRELVAQLDKEWRRRAK